MLCCRAPCRKSLKAAFGVLPLDYRCHQPSITLHVCFDRARGVLTGDTAAARVVSQSTRALTYLT